MFCDTIYHRNRVGNEPLMHSVATALAFKAVLAKQNSSSTLDSVPALAALNESTHFECEIRSWCAIYPPLLRFIVIECPIVTGFSSFKFC